LASQHAQLVTEHRDLLVVLVAGIVTHREATELVAKTGILVKGRDGGFVKNPALQIQRDAAMVILRCAEHFGLSPSARSRISMPPGREDEIARRYLSRPGCSSSSRPAAVDADRCFRSYQLVSRQRSSELIY
jgi:P27 family predicted phage terminase small subunit